MHEYPLALQLRIHVGMLTSKMLHLQLSLTAKTFMKDNADMTVIELLSCHCRDCGS